MATETKGGGGFARDLGYLDAFFDKLDAHAATLDAAAGARLKALIAEERTRWKEIRALVAGGAPAARSLAPTPEAPGAPAPTAPHSFTIGSLSKR